MATLLIGVGSNLGDRATAIRSAVTLLSSEFSNCSLSRVYETRPVLHPENADRPQGPFLNAVVHGETTREPRDVLQTLLTIERRVGRTREESAHPWAPRVIDLDLLSYADYCLEEADLVIPHPRMHERDFVLLPLIDVAPKWQHPRLGLLAKDLLPDACRSVERVVSFKPLETMMATDYPQPSFSKSP